MKCTPSETKPDNMGWHSPLRVSLGTLPFSSPSLVLSPISAEHLFCFSSHQIAQSEHLQFPLQRCHTFNRSCSTAGMYGSYRSHTVSNTALGQFPKSLACAIHSTCITLHCLNFSDRKRASTNIYPSRTQCNTHCTAPIP